VPEQKAYIGYAILIGIPMAIAVLALYLAISKGPVSVVMPIYALNATVTAILGMAVLHEPVTLPKILGLVFAVAALVLLSR
jgi:transporter family protein